MALQKIFLAKSPNRRDVRTHLLTKLFTKLGGGLVGETVDTGCDRGLVGEVPRDAALVLCSCAANETRVEDQPVPSHSKGHSIACQQVRKRLHMCACNSSFDCVSAAVSILPMHRDVRFRSG